MDPAEAAPGEYLGLGYGEADLDTVAVKFDLVDPAPRPS